MQLRVSSNFDLLLSGEPTKAHNKGVDWERVRTRMHRGSYGDVSFGGRGWPPQEGWLRECLNNWDLPHTHPCCCCPGLSPMGGAMVGGGGTEVDRQGGGGWGVTAAVTVTLHCITLHYITLHYITLHHITLHHITLHYITLHYIHSFYGQACARNHAS
jgi:hypothetical protein